MIKKAMETQEEYDRPLEEVKNAERIQSAQSDLSSKRIYVAEALGLPYTGEEVSEC